jgi:hypothetical protein
MVDGFPSETGFSRILNLITQTQKCQVQIWNQIWHEGHQWKFNIGPWFYFHCQYNHVEVTIMLFMLYNEVTYDMKDINGSLTWSLILLLPLQIQSCWGHNNVAHLVLWSILGTGHCAHFAAWSEISPYPHPNPIWRGSETKWAQWPVPSMRRQIMVFMDFQQWLGQVDPKSPVHCAL